MSQLQHQTNPLALPMTGCSRWRDFEIFCPVSRETYRKMVKQGKAPQPIRMGIRCTFYKNEELHKFLNDPTQYESVN